ncbi:hypothetical protein HCH_06515 [Hahella chejuensis KCTC 2396]|uniref:Uncharacterized protein n=1 Tax=Hahella chejuensis (strain KCTC 2396) TaxID=349521 RepID=Q2S869_HAHCH|nr:hypothetical protein HCH_06515 [Hahella chejuensis KCTC 2396]
MLWEALRQAQGERLIPIIETQQERSPSTGSGRTADSDY